MNDDRVGKGLRELSRSDTTWLKFLLKSLLSFYLNMIENIKTKDYTYNDIAGKLREYIICKRSLRLEEIQRKPIVLMLEPITKGKTWNYSKSKGRLGKEHMEESCWTKARDKKKAEAKAAKQKEAEGKGDSSNDEKIQIGVVRIKLAWNETNKYQFDPGTTYYTTNKRSCLSDIQEIILR